MGIKCLIRATKKKNSQFTVKDLQNDLKNISVQSIIKTLYKYDLQVGISCRMPLLTKKNM